MLVDQWLFSENKFRTCTVLTKLLLYNGQGEIKQYRAFVPLWALCELKKEISRWGWWVIHKWGKTKWGTGGAYFLQTSDLHKFRE